MRCQAEAGHRSEARHRWIGWLALLALAVSAPPAAAHEIWPGMPGVVSMLLHPFLAPEIAVVMVALALLAGAEGWSRTLVLCGPCIAAGAGIGMRLQAPLLSFPGLWWWPLIWAGLLGLLLASGVRIGRRSTLSVALLSAVTVGLGVSRERPFLSGAIEAWAGATMAMLILAMTLALPRAFAEGLAVRTAWRVAGAWIAAIAALGLAAAALR